MGCGDYLSFGHRSLDNEKQHWNYGEASVTPEEDSRLAEHSKCLRLWVFSTNADREHVLCRLFAKGMQRRICVCTEIW